MAPKKKIKDDGPPANAYTENALFKRLSQHPSKCQVIPEGALVLVGMSLLWRDSRLYPAIQRFDNGKCQFVVSKFVGDVYSDMLIISVKTADSFAQPISPPPSGGSEVSIGGTKKIFRIRITGKKSSIVEVTASPSAADVLTAPEGTVVTSAPVIISPHRSLKRHKTMPFL
ncbi:hypothetical protein Hanom_Chr04g00316991 [Helianthus anomalus]